MNRRSRRTLAKQMKKFNARMKPQLAHSMIFNRVCNRLTREGVDFYIQGDTFKSNNASYVDKVYDEESERYRMEQLKKED